MVGDERAEALATRAPHRGWGAGRGAGAVGAADGDRGRRELEAGASHRLWPDGPRLRSWCAPLAVNFGPLPLEPGRYQWKFTVDGESEPTWSRSFTKVSATTTGRPSRRSPAPAAGARERVASIGGPGQ